MSSESYKTIFYRFCRLFLPLIFSGCSNGYRAESKTPPYRTLDIAFQQADENPLIDYHAPLPNEWWTLFDDEQLNGFIDTAFSRNPTLDAARAKIFSAKFQADRVRSSLFPHLSWGADVSRQKLSETGLIPFDQNQKPVTTSIATLPVPAGQNGIPVYFTQYETEFILTYEFDFWGKNSNLLKAAIGSMQSAMADEIFSRLQLGIAVAKTYFQLQTNYKRREIAERLVENRERYLALSERRLTGNIDSGINLNRSRADVSAAKQSLLEIEADIIANEHQLKYYLAGDFDEEILPIEISETSLRKVPLPSDLPLNLLAHRPDIISQLWLIESAGKRIEVAKAGFYPNFSLGAIFGFQTIHLHKLFEWKSSDYNINPAVSLPIFDGGLLCSELHASEVNYDIAIYRYNELIISAAREVLESLAILRNSEKQRLESVETAAREKKIYELTNLRMIHKLNSRQDTLTAEQAMLLAQDVEILALANTFQAILSLIKSLGGGYEICYEEKT